MSFKALLDTFDTLLAPIAKAPESDAVKVLTDVYERIGAMLSKAQESNGVLPEAMAAEITTAAGMLLSLAPPGTAHLAQPGTVPVVLSQATKRALAVRMTKAELDAYTARVATMNAANDRWWKMRNLFEQGKDAEANAEMKGIAEMLNNTVATVSTGDAASTVTAADKREVAFSQEQFAAYAVAEVQKAAQDTKEEAVKRLTHLRALSALAKAWFFEGTSPGLPWKVEVLAAYAPEGDGKVMDLTTTKDQSDTTGNLLGGNTGNQTASMFKAETLAKVEDALKELLGDLGVTPPPPAGDPPSGETTDVTKGAASADASLWPSDLAAAVKADEEEAAQKKKGIKKSASGDALSFGKDPWHASRRSMAR